MSNSNTTPTKIACRPDQGTSEAMRQQPREDLADPATQQASPGVASSPAQHAALGRKPLFRS